MYLWDIQFKMWHGRIATNSRLFQMNIKETEACTYCQQRETSVHAFVLCDRAQNFWREISLYLSRLGYRKFRLEQNVLIFGDTEMDPLFNIVIIIGKKVIYLNRGRGNQYSMRHFEALLELERESEEVYANNNDTQERYERKWEKYITEY